MGETGSRCVRGLRFRIPVVSREGAIRNGERERGEIGGVEHEGVACPVLSVQDMDDS